MTTKRGKHGKFHGLINWILGLFGYHLSKNPPKGRRVIPIPDEVWPGEAA